MFALDLPSGLNADSGAVMGAAVRADCTISFVALKTGLFLGDGPEYAGRLLFDDLEVTAPAGAAISPRCWSGWARARSRARCRRGARQANKGDFGRVLIVGGGPGMPGAVRLAGEACLRVGAGLVTVATARDNLTAIAAGRPELIVHAVEQPEELVGAAERGRRRGDRAGSGPLRLGARTAGAHAGCGKPLVIDADALNLLAEQRPRRTSGSVLTPHPGEAARLLGISTAAVQADRMAALHALHAAPSRARSSCSRARARWSARCMACAQSGARHLRARQSRHGGRRHGRRADRCASPASWRNAAIPWLAARAGVMAHALAGDDLARERERGILALELAEALNRWVNLRR